ncbi:hypothetical protein C9426_12910 [Serratia sp. S1B]|nr:hypothetical protein C9426_12910 [Serratia sp. S1B]
MNYRLIDVRKEGVKIAYLSQIKGDLTLKKRAFTRIVIGDVGYYNAGLHRYLVALPFKSLCSARYLAASLIMGADRKDK